MLNKLRERRDNESGFTLIELLVVILIIGILAAIALPAFLGQQTKGQDSSAKSNARNAVSQLESCFATEQTYVGCSLTGSGLTAGTGQEEVNLPSANQSATGYQISVLSKSGNTFLITKTGGSPVSRTCTVGSGGDRGGCRTGNSW